jgi:anaerobic ribonucleoside-triphosphate reductase activating protein
MATEINLHRMISHTKALGPGTRAVLWFQGCEKRCPGCMSEESRDPALGRRVPVDVLYARVASLRDIEGITVSGGEPFLQAGGLCALLRKLRENTKLGVILYTGYYLEELRAARAPEIDEILSGLADIVIDGPYVDALNDGKALRGSANQSVHFLTDRYVETKALFDENKRDIEMRVSPDEVFFIGVPDKDAFAALKEAAENPRRRRCAVRGTKIL